MYVCTIVWTAYQELCLGIILPGNKSLSYTVKLEPKTWIYNILSTVNPHAQVKLIDRYTVYIIIVLTAISITADNNPDC